MKSFYHITKKANWDKIQKEGLKNNGDGIFFVSVDKEMVLFNIAMRQILIEPDEKFVVLSIPENIIGKMEMDKAQETYSHKGYQWISDVKHIPPKSIKLHAEYQLSRDDMDKAYYDYNIENFGKETADIMHEFMVTQKNIK